jgi:hypothetical protein
MATSTSVALYMSWVERNGLLTGTLQDAELDQTGAKVLARTFPVSGVRSGQDISLDVSGVGTWQREVLGPGG